MAGKDEKFGSVPPRDSDGSAQEAEVFGALGSLLGVLEVIATDDAVPLSDAHAARMRTALSYGLRLQQYVEALLTLVSDDLGQRLRPARARLRPLLEHAIRGALRGAPGGEIELRWPSDAGWDSEHVKIDVSRVDRAINALVTELVLRVGGRGVLSVEVEPQDDTVRVSVRGEPRDAAVNVRHSQLLSRAADRLLALQGGSVTVDSTQLNIALTLPRYRERTHESADPR